MALNTTTIAMISVAIGVVGMVWAIFWPVRAQPGRNPVSTHWDIVYIDDDGVMVFTLVRVIQINPATRRMTGWCATKGGERIFKLGKIVKAVDVRSGARIDVNALCDVDGLPDALPDASPEALSSDGTRGETAQPARRKGGWWRVSRLGFR